MTIERKSNVFYDEGMNKVALLDGDKILKSRPLTAKEQQQFNEGYSYFPYGDAKQTCAVLMSTEIHKTAPDLRSFKGNYVIRQDERKKAENARKADYKGFLKSNAIRDLLEELERERL